MGVAKTIARNVASNQIGFASQILITFFLTPFVIEHLGLEAYGLWLFLQSTVGYYGLVDLGLRAGLTQIIAKRIAKQDSEAVRQHLATTIPTLAMVALVVLVLGLLLATVLPGRIQLSPELARLIPILVVMQAVAFGIRLPFAPYTAILVGMQRYDLSNIVSVATRVGSAVVTVVALLNGGGILAIALVGLATNFVDSFVRMLVVRKLLPCVRNIKYRIDFRELKHVGKYGLWNSLINASGQLIFFSDALVIGLLFSAKAVAPFGLAGSLIDYSNRLVQQSTRVLFPTMTQLRVTGDLKTQRRVYSMGTRIAAGLSISIAIIGAFAVSSFLRLWLQGSEEAELIIRDGPGIFAILAIGFISTSVQRVGSQLMLAAEFLKELAFILLLEAVANLILSIVLASQIGVLGVAYGTMIPACILVPSLHLKYHARILQLSHTQTLKLLLLRPGAFAVCLLPTIGTLWSLMPDPQSWLGLVGLGCASAIAAAIPFALIILSQEERLIIKGKILSLLGRKNRERAATSQ